MNQVITEKELRQIISRAINEVLLSELHKIDLPQRQIMPHLNYDKISQWTLNNEILDENENNFNWIMRKHNWEINNYERFIRIIENCRDDLKGFLTYHPLDELKQGDWRTYTLKRYDVAFALHWIDNGKIDFCNFINNSQLHGIGNAVLTFAKMEGATQMDNYRGENGDEGKLGRLYRDAGYTKQTWFDNFNPDFQPNDAKWRLDTEKWGRPDVEGLERPDHTRRYNNPQSNYKRKFDNRINSKFNLNNDNNNV